MVTRTALLLAASAVLAGACRVNAGFGELPATEQAALRPAAATVASIGQGQAMPPAPGAAPAASPEVRQLDAALVRQFAAGSSRPYTDVYVYATFCKPCVAELPALLAYYARRPDVNLLLVSPESWTQLPAIKKFLAAQRVAFPTYVLDLPRYGDEYGVGRRYQRFVAELHPGHPELQGLPTHLVLNQQAQVFFAGVGQRVTTAVLDSVLRQR